MSKDPEMDSIANFATLHIIRTYDPSKGVPIQRWIARCVRQHVWQYWRKERRRKEVHKEPIWWTTKIIATQEVDYSEFPLLHKIYVEGMTQEEVAIEMCVSVYEVRKRIKECLTKYLQT